MYRIAVLLIVSSLFIIGCTPDTEELVRNFVRELGLNYDEDNEVFECYSGNARLPEGENPGYAVTPNGYHLNCGDRGMRRFNSDGTFTGRTGSTDNQLYVEQWTQCGIGTEPPEERGKWVIVDENNLCLWEDIAPGIISCTDAITIWLDPSGRIVESLAIDGYVEIYDENNFLISSHDNQVVCRLMKD